MPKSEQTLMLTYWQTHIEPDQHTLSEMLQLADAGVFDAQFIGAVRKSLFMKFRADDGDMTQLATAISYAKRSLFRAVHPDNVRDLQVWFNGERIVLETQTTENA